MHMDFKPVVSQIQAIIRFHNGRSRGQFAHYGRCLSRYELIYKWSGSSVTHFGDRIFELKQGAVLYLPKGDIHGEYAVETIEQGDAIDILFDTSGPCSSEPWLINMNESPTIANLFEKAHRLWLSGPASRYLRCMALTYQIMSEIQDHEERRYLPPAQSAMLQAAMTYLDQNCFQRSFDYKQLAELAGVSYSYFKRIFVDKYGIPPSRYLAMRKMECARNLLRNPESSITQISEQLGYESVYYFSRVFRLETGVSPSKYRLQQINSSD